MRGAKVGNFFKSFMDESRIEALGMRPLQSVLADIRKARTRAQIAAIMGHAPYGFQSSLFSIGISVDPKEPTRYAVFVDQSGLGLPNRDYYLDSRFAAEKSSYHDYAKRLLDLIRWPDSGSAADEILKLESRIAQASWTRAQSRDIESSYNPMTVAELEALAPNFPWRSFLAAARLGRVDRVIVRQKSAFSRIATIFSETPVDTLRAWLAFTAADGASPYLSGSFDRAAFDFHSKTLSSLQEEEPRVKRAIRAVGGDPYANSGNFGNMGWAVGELYVQRYFSADQKMQVEALVRTLLAAFRKRLEQVDWMSAPTKQEALRKLDAYVIKVGYPTNPRDYSRVLIRAHDLVGNVLRTARADWGFYVGRLTRPVDREEWLLTPQTDNAYNTGSILAIEFPAALLQAPMFDPQADAAVNYGAIGAFIGHEITHGFDDQGRKVDAEGRLRDWWTAADAKEFERLAAALGAQYAAYEPLPGVFVDAAATMGETSLTSGASAWRSTHIAKACMVTRHR
jgi:putative endopeptidase